MKKLTYILICVCLTMALAVTAFAADTAEMTITADKETLAPGESVTFVVTLAAMENCRSAGVQLTYDQDVFVFAEGSCSLETAVVASFKDGTGVFTFAEPMAVEGEIFTFRLQVKDDAAPGSYSITAKGSVRNAEGAVTTKVNGASVSVTTETTAESQAAPTQPAEETLPASEPMEEMPQKGNQPTDTVPPVYTIGADPATTGKPFPWWILAVVVVIVAGGTALALGRKKK